MTRTGNEQVSQRGENALEPLAVSVETVTRLTDESKTTVYDLIAAGEYTAIKSGRKTLIVYESVKRRLAGLPKVTLTRKRVR
jgi:excisionase family DNA binding protein